MLIMLSDSHEKWYKAVLAALPPSFKKKYDQIPGLTVSSTS